MVEGAVGTDFQIKTSGDYCNYYNIGEGLDTTNANKQSESTGYEPPSPLTSYQEGDHYSPPNVCQAYETFWGHVLRGAGNSNCEAKAPCGMQHYVSLGEQGLNDRPWSSSFGEPSLVISADVLPWTQSIKTGAWGYLCPLFEDETTGDILEYCLAEWTHGKGFPAIAHYDVVAACASPGSPPHNLDQTITQFASGTQFAENAGSETTFNYESNNKWRDFSARITESNLRAAIRMDNEKFEGTGGNPNPGKGCGRGSSTEPKNWALIGIEHGIEGGGLSELGESEANLQLWTEYTPAPTVSTESATNVAQTQATVNGAVNPNGGDTHYYFQYGTTTSYGSTAPALPGNDAGSGTSSVPVSVTLTGLTKYTTYHYRLVATNVGGTSYGSDHTLETSDSFIGQPSAVAQENGTIDVFGRLADNELGHDWRFNGQWYGAENFAASMASEPSAVQTSSGTLDVFWRGTDNNLWHVWYTPTTGWNGPQDLGMGPLGGAPHAVGQSNGDVNVFWRGESKSNYGLYEALYTPSGGWHGPEALGGGPLGSEPVPVVSESGSFNVYWVGEANSDYSLYHMWYKPNTGWSGAESLGYGPLGSIPGAASPRNGNVDVFWAAAESAGMWGALYTASNNTWTGPLYVGG